MNNASGDYAIVETNGHIEFARWEVADSREIAVTVPTKYGLFIPICYTAQMFYKLMISDFEVPKNQEIDLVLSGLLYSTSGYYLVKMKLHNGRGSVIHQKIDNSTDFIYAHGTDTDRLVNFAMTINDQKSGLAIPNNGVVATFRELHQKFMIRVNSIVVDLDTYGPNGLAEKLAIYDTESVPVSVSIGRDGKRLISPEIELPPLK